MAQKRTPINTDGIPENHHEIVSKLTEDDIKEIHLLLNRLKSTHFQQKQTIEEVYKMCLETKQATDVLQSIIDILEDQE